jgi:hypothetical protein
MNWVNNRLSTKALYWPPPQKDGYGGNIWAYPDEINSRWKDSGRSIVYDKTGAEVVSNTIVWIEDLYLLVGGYIMRGDLYSLHDLSEPPIEEAYDIADGLVVSQEYARQIVDIERITSIYNKRMSLTKLWLK